MREKFKKGEIVSATRTFNGEIITGEFLGYRLFNDENPDTVVGIVDVPGEGVYDVDVTSLKHYVKSTRYSDDEKIRNEIIDFFRSAANGQTKVISGANSLMWADWLEKQKEQKPQYIYLKFREGDIIQKITGGDIVTIAEVDTDAEEYRLTNSGFIPFKYEHLWYLIEQKPAEWSEEDETKLRDVVRLVEDSGHVKSIREHYEKFLTSLPERFNLRPEQEWSEEDEEMRNLIIAIFEVNHPDGFFKANELGTTDMRGVHTEEVISWLKSLRPSWKPSKEQIGLLGKVYNLIWADPATPADVQDGLGDFIEQLRTL